MVCCGFATKASIMLQPHPKTAGVGDGRYLQTLSDPDAYHLFVFGFRDTYTFDLKAPLSRKVFDWATDEIYQHTESADEPGASIPNEPVNGGAKEHNE